MRLIKLIPDDTNIRFLEQRNIAIAVSVLLMVASVVLLVVRGLNFGVDFAGGMMMEVRFEQPVQLDQLRRTVNSAGVGEGSLQTFGDPRTVSIHLPLPDGEAAATAAVNKVKAAITKSDRSADFQRVETVSGKVSGELIRSGVLAMVLAMAAIAVYIWFRFEWQFGIGVLFGLVHDVVLTFGFFALTQLEFDLNIVAAILTIIGYSLNDTIVVYDRIRDNLRKYRKMEMVDLLDLSVNETLARTVVTSLTMIIALGTMVALGGSVLFGFSVAMLLGIGIGTYSSVFVSAPFLLWLRVGPHTFVASGKGPEEKLQAKLRAERGQV